MDENLTQDLLNNYVYQKSLLLEEAGVQGALNEERLHILMRPRIEKMAAVIEDWDVRPDIIMAAVFGWAKRNRHPDGPMPNMLASPKYLMKALGDYLQVPFEAVSERRCMSVFMERKDFLYDQSKRELEKAGVTDLVTATTYPVEFRCLMALSKLDWEAVGYLAEETLIAISADRRVAMWLARKGVTYERLAKIFNNWKKKTLS